jgi:hypothetical protein
VELLHQLTKSHLQHIVRDQGRVIAHVLMSACHSDVVFKPSDFTKPSSAIPKLFIVPPMTQFRRFKCTSPLPTNLTFFSLYPGLEEIDCML